MSLKIKVYHKTYIFMQYYRFELDEESKDLCGIITSFDQYKEKSLPISLKFTPDFDQKFFEQVLQWANNVNIFLDNIGIFSET